MSIYLTQNLTLTLPKAILLNNHNEYPLPITIPVAPRKVTLVLHFKDPANIRNSPIKLLVPGKLIFANVKNRKIVIYKGITVAKPP